MKTVDDLLNSNNILNKPTKNKAHNSKLVEFLVKHTFIAKLI